jgi:hypothetical protein
MIVNSKLKYKKGSLKDITEAICCGCFFPDLTGFTGPLAFKRLPDYMIHEMSGIIQM